MKPLILICAILLSSCATLGTMFDTVFGPPIGSPLGTVEKPAVEAPVPKTKYIPLYTASTESPDIFVQDVAVDVGDPSLAGKDYDFCFFLYGSPTVQCYSLVESKDSQWEDGTMHKEHRYSASLFDINEMGETDSSSDSSSVAE